MEGRQWNIYKVSGISHNLETSQPQVFCGALAYSAFPVLWLFIYCAVKHRRHLTVLGNRQHSDRHKIFRHFPDENQNFSRSWLGYVSVNANWVGTWLRMHLNSTVISILIFQVDMTKMRLNDDSFPLNGQLERQMRYSVNFLLNDLQFIFLGFLEEEHMYWNYISMSECNFLIHVIRA